jgi:hypothetical protein
MGCPPSAELVKLLLFAFSTPFSMIECGCDWQCRFHAVLQIFASATEHAVKVHLRAMDGTTGRTAQSGVRVIQ